MLCELCRKHYEKPDIRMVGPPEVEESKWACVKCVEPPQEEDQDGSDEG